jgi:short subunit dehydrogenase-like uncharacterized protein
VARKAELDFVIFGATGFTGRLIAKRLADTYGDGGKYRWGLAGRDGPGLAHLRDRLGWPRLPLILADVNDPRSLDEMARRARFVLSAVGPYQLYGTPVLEACLREGAGYVDMCGEPHWMADMIRRYDAKARERGVTALLSCGFDSTVWELGVMAVQETAQSRFGRPAPEVRSRLLRMKGALSGGTAATARETISRMMGSPQVAALLRDPFALTPGFRGPEQPDGESLRFDPDIARTVGPILMAAINTKNIHRSNFLQGHPWGRDFRYEELAVIDDEEVSDGGSPLAATAPRPGDGPPRSVLEAGYFDIMVIGIDPSGRRIACEVQAKGDPAYLATSRIVSEILAAASEAPVLPAGLWTAGAALGSGLADRLTRSADVTFTTSVLAKG